MGPIRLEAGDGEEKAVGQEEAVGLERSGLIKAS